MLLWICSYFLVSLPSDIVTHVTCCPLPFLTDMLTSPLLIYPAFKSILLEILRFLVMTGLKVKITELITCTGITSQEFNLVAWIVSFQRTRSKGVIVNCTFSGCCQWPLSSSFQASSISVGSQSGKTPFYWCVSTVYSAMMPLWACKRDTYWAQKHASLGCWLLPSQKQIYHFNQSFSQPFQPIPLHSP